MWTEKYTATFEGQKVQITSTLFGFDQHFRHSYAFADGSEVTVDINPIPSLDIPELEGCESEVDLYDVAEKKAAFKFLKILTIRKMGFENLITVHSDSVDHRFEPFHECPWDNEADEALDHLLDRDAPDLDPEATELVEQLEMPDAKFIGYQKIPGGPSLALFTILKEGHLHFCSTVSLETLQKLGLKVPEYPSVWSFSHSNDD